MVATYITCALYCLAGLLTGCRVAAYLAYYYLDDWNRKDYNVRLDGHRSAPTGEQWFGAALWGIAAAVVWPFVLIAFLARARLFAPPKRVREREQRKRIEELERQLDRELGTP